MRNPFHSICPYFAMFPESFVEEQVKQHTTRGDVVFDCFSGRGTTVFQSLLMHRQAAAMDINPVAYCISAAKAAIPDLDDLHQRLEDLEYCCWNTPWRFFERELRDLSPFFWRAFHLETLPQVLFLRRALAWKRSQVDRFLAALALGSLHGEMDKSESYFSNQMPRTISTKPDYSLKYWRQHRLKAPRRDVFRILRERLELRFDGSVPDLVGRVARGDARNCMATFPELAGRVRALITSPPYHDVTNFEEDQWLRLWFLGYEPRPTYRTISPDDRYRSSDSTVYWRFLTEVWKGVAPLMRPTSVIVCRLGAKGVAQSLLTRRLNETIRAAFPKAKPIGRPAVSKIRNKQRDRFQPGTKGCLFEIDYVFSTS